MTTSCTSLPGWSTERPETFALSSRVTIRDLNNGAILEKRLRSGEEVEQVDLDRRQMEYLYEQNGKFVFMDLESFDQVELPKEIIGDMPLYVLPNSQVVVLWCDGRPISIEMPMSVTLVVTDTAPGIKGATATNQLKEATCETGLKTRVPPFITLLAKRSLWAPKTALIRNARN